MKINDYIAKIKKLGACGEALKDIMLSGMYRGRKERQKSEAGDEL